MHKNWMISFQVAYYFQEIWFLNQIEFYSILQIQFNGHWQIFAIDYQHFQLQMGTLQSRLDAEFLLAHMCSVKFKEWIVVLATLLRRSEVLLILFLYLPYVTYLVVLAVFFFPSKLMLIFNSCRVIFQVLWSTSILSAHKSVSTLAFIMLI